MRTFSHVFAAAAMTIAGIPSQILAADQKQAYLNYANMKPAMVLKDTALNSRLIMLHTGELDKGRYVIERARVDDAMKIVCEWRAISRIETANNGRILDVVVEEHDGHCMDMEQMPAAWGKAAERDIRMLPGDTASGVFKNPKNSDNIIYEWSQRSDYQKGVLSMTLRKWDMAAKTVCLDTSEALQSGLISWRTYESRAWGCFPIKNQPYADMLIKQFDRKKPPQEIGYSFR